MPKDENNFYRSHQFTKENRQYQRMRMILGIVCHRTSSPDVTIFTDDVSAGGIKFSCGVEIKSGEDVVLELPVGHGHYDRVEGRVSRIRQEEKDNKFTGAIVFDRMSETTKKKWEKYIERNTEKL